MDTERGKITNIEHAREFVIAGNATFTLVSLKTGTRFTYKVRKAEDKENFWFVSLLTGSDNESNYRYLCVMSDKGLRWTGKSCASQTAPSSVALLWFWRQTIMPDTLEFWHEGRCGRCGRKLTVPDSVERGIGPECATRMVA